MNCSESKPKESFPWFTGTGDDGTTQLLGNARVPKYDCQPETFGTLDEASSALGLARALCRADGVIDVILTVQKHLYRMMSELAATPENVSKYTFTNESHVDWLEQQTNHFGEKIDMPRDFVVPGNTPAGGAMDLARAIVRRAERQVVLAAAENRVSNPWIARYLNRLSSLCYVLARVEDASGTDSPLTVAKDNTHTH
jgi:cob(I)alamin adenosyltransferase